MYMNTLVESFGSTAGGTWNLCAREFEERSQKRETSIEVYGRFADRRVAA